MAEKSMGSVINDAFNNFQDVICSRTDKIKYIASALREAGYLHVSEIQLCDCMEETVTNQPRLTCIACHGEGWYRKTEKEG